MFAHRHVSSSLRPCLRSIPRPLASSSGSIQCRGIASSPSLRSEHRAPPTPGEAKLDAINEDMLSQPETDKAAKPTTYQEFLTKIGHKFQYSEPLSYLGDTPFPMNPSYKPPPPISDEQKEVIFQLYMSHRLENGPRRLARRFNLSLKRINAILRLKLFEHTFESKNRKLQTGFQFGMERLLGATTHSAVPNAQEQMSAKGDWLTAAWADNRQMIRDGLDDPNDPTHPHFVLPKINQLRADVQKADLLEQEEKRDESTSHYERLYWESVQDDGREPLMPSILQTEKQKAEMRKINNEVRARKQFLVRKPQTQFIRRPDMAVFVRGKPRGRKGPITKFLDVGGQFMDVDARIKALGVSRNRAARRAKKAEEMKQLYVKPS